MIPPSLVGLPPDCTLGVYSHLAVRDLLALACCCKAQTELLKEDAVWEQLARRKWGEWVPKLASVPAGGWRDWCKHRMSVVSIQASPLALVQESYQDPWQHLAACLLCSRTTGGPVVREAIRSFLARWPTPSGVLDASRGELLDRLHPVGLQEVRLAALTAMSHYFLGTDWEDPTEFKGCGKFVADSWRIFCRGHRSLAGIEDANLQRYLRWLLQGEPGEKKPRQRSTSKARMRAGSKPAAEPGRLRSGKRRAANATGALPERRQTRRSAAQQQAAGPAAAGSGPARRTRAAGLHF